MNTKTYDPKTSKLLRKIFARFQEAGQDFNLDDIAQALPSLFHKECSFKFCHPLGEFSGTPSFLERCLQPLSRAFSDLERRDMIVVAGASPDHELWLGCMGNYFGTFTQPFLGIPPTGHLAHMRYHEFFRFENNNVVEMQAIWDIPELMMQANAWPMPPQLGAFLCTPAPMSADGLTLSGNGADTYTHVINMLEDLCRHPANPDPKVMQLEKYWHPKFNWYGPAGIGTARGNQGFRHWHQIPFLRGMPDRKLDAMGDLKSHWIAQENYVCETGWPNMRLTLSGDGWLGIPPIDKEVLLRSLDFWRLENGRIRENWVLVDLLHMYHQIGVDVLARMQEFNKAKSIGAITLPDSMKSVAPE